MHERIRDDPVFIQEKRVIMKMVAQKKPVLSICQDAPDDHTCIPATGVYSNPGRRGKYCLHGYSQGIYPLSPESYNAIHWHNKMFNLSRGATLLSTGRLGKTSHSALAV